jgi:hypothetical protein
MARLLVLSRWIKVLLRELISGLPTVDSIIRIVLIQIEVRKIFPELNMFEMC